MIAQLHPPIKALIPDMDGVLWAGREALIDIPAAFRKMDDPDLWKSSLHDPTWLPKT